MKFFSKFLVTPDERPFAIVNLNSSALVNGDLVGLTHGNMDIDVKSFGEL